MILSESTWFLEQPSVSSQTVGADMVGVYDDPDARNGCIERRKESALLAVLHTDVVDG